MNFVEIFRRDDYAGTGRSQTLQEKEVDIKPSSEEKHYKFITPWLGLNQVNYQKYSNLTEWKDKKELLNKILVGNLLSMSKGLGNPLAKPELVLSFICE